MSIQQMFFSTSAADQYKLWAWGSNNVGQLGLGDTTSRSSPTQIGALTSWSQVALMDTGTSNSSAFALDSNNALYSWGYNGNGQLALGNTTNVSSPTQVGSTSNWKEIQNGGGIGVRTDGTLWQWGITTISNYSSPVQVGTATDWKSVAIGYFQGPRYAINTSNNLYSWGENGRGQLGDGTNTNTSAPAGAILNSIQKVTTGTGFAYALRTNGYVYTWGGNDFGQLADGTTNDSNTPLLVWSGSSDIACGAYHALLINSGYLYSVGWNVFGQLGSGNTTDRTSINSVGSLNNWSKVYCGTYSSYAIKTDGTLWAWGYNANGQLGTNNTTSYSSPVQVGTKTNWLSLSSCNSGSSVLAITKN